MPAKKKISEKADKRRRAKVVVGHDADGEPIIKYASGRTKAELEANKEELRRSYIGGREVQRDVMVSQYITSWYDNCKAGEIAASTAQNYASAINKHILPVFGDKRMSAVTSLELRTFAASLKGLSKTTIGDIFSVLRNSFALAAADGVIDRDPMIAVKKPSATSTHRRDLTEAETKAVLKVASSNDHGLLLKLLYYTGARRGEVLGLKWSDIDFKNGLIHIERDIDYVTNSEGDVKSECSVRDVPLAYPLRAALLEQQVRGKSYILQGKRTGTHIPQITYVRLWKSLMADVYRADTSIEHIDLNDGLKDAPELIGSILTAHYFRHNYATMLYAAGVDVLTAQKYLGHSDPATTLRIYTHLKKTMAEDDRQKVIDLFGGDIGLAAVI